MKVGPEAKVDKRNKTTSKKFDDDVMSKIVTSLLFFNLQPICRKLIFSLIVTFYLTKTENGTKKSLTQLSHYFFE